MSWEIILLSILPSVMLFLCGYLIKKFIPKRENAFWSKAPQWWSINDQVWNSGFQNLSKLYIRYSIYSFIISILTAISFHHHLAIAICFVVTLIFASAAVFKNHSYMQRSFHKNGLKK